MTAHALNDLAGARITKSRPLCARLGISRSTLWREVHEDRFPKPIEISPRSFGWIEAEVDAWLAARIQQREAA